MLPDLSIRINNLIKSLEKTIIPAIDPDNGMALEQAALMVGHLKMFDQQWDTAYLYEVRSLENIKALASYLATTIDQQGEPRVIAEEIETLIGSIPDDLPKIVSEITAYIVVIGKLVDRLIDSVFSMGSPNLIDKVTKTVLDYNARQSARDRIWFSAIGLDPDPSDLSSMEEMLFTDLYKYNP